MSTAMARTFERMFVHMMQPGAKERAGWIQLETGNPFQVSKLLDLAYFGADPVAVVIAGPQGRVFIPFDKIAAVQLIDV